ncbi:MAG: transketolase C-terminal domain-containing protein, partial [Thermoleophilaceae bacterium]
AGAARRGRRRPGGRALMESASIRPSAVDELLFVGLSELEAIRGLGTGPVARAAAFADACRLNTLSMIAEAGSGHIGTSFSCMDMLAWLHLEVLGDDDRYFSSKGHDAPALYATLIGLGRLDFGLVHRLRRLGGLPGHPDVPTTPQVLTNTGSLGMGVSKAKGFVLADRAAGRSGRVFVMTGDGELQEGQFWESLPSAANRGLGEITAIVDHNKLQSDTWVNEVSDLGDLTERVSSCGWAVARCDGNDIGAFSGALGSLLAENPDRPKLLVADTVKGKGVSFMEPHDLPAAGDSLYAYHSGAPAADEYGRAASEILERLQGQLADAGGSPARTESLRRPPIAPAPAEPQRLVAAYGRALADAAANEPALVALDADLYLDTGLIEFRDRFPERFYECGIAEQDMVSQAGAMALTGLLPAVHSFACFLSTRPNEQIYNNATERTKVIYTGSLVGIVPGGPGHSHQSVRDISALGAMPGMALIEPASEHETRLAVKWAVHEATGPVYIRLVSVPWELGFEPPRAERLVPGRGEVVSEGGDATIVTTGPVMLSQAFAAAQRLTAGGRAVGVVSLPWLRGVDGEWLAQVTGEAPVFCLDNHYVDGGQGDAVLAALAAAGATNRVHKLGVESVPVCGTNDEVLRAHRLDAESLAERIDARIDA